MMNLNKTSEQTAIRFLDFNLLSRTNCKNTIISSNTEINEGSVKLFGNKIAWFDNNNLIVNMCGYGSQTTRQRLNAILDLYINSPYTKKCHGNKIEQLSIRQFDHKQVLVAKFKEQPQEDNVDIIRNMQADINISELLEDMVKRGKGINELKFEDKPKQEKPKLEIIHESQWVRVRDYT